MRHPLLACGTWFLCASLNVFAGDFNGDGFQDLAVGSPSDNFHDVANAGAVHVLPGSAAGPVAAAALLIDAGDFDHDYTVDMSFGNAVAWGDFDGDGFDDLAIGAFGVMVNDLAFAGRVFVVPGSAAGFDFARAVTFDQSTKHVADKPEFEDLFGSELAVGDFNGDGHDDLVVGSQRETIAGALHAGTVHVFYGSPSGLRAKGSQYWHQNRPGIKDKCEPGESFGISFAVGDLNGDGFDDLATPVIAETTSSSATPGRVAVLFGSPKKLRSKGNLLLEPTSASVPVTINAGGGAFAITCANFDGDGFDDLAIGVLYSTLTVDKQNQGAVFLARGSADGPTVPMEVFAFGVAGVPGTGATDDFFGAGLVAGDFNADAADDLAIYVPGSNGVPSFAGRVVVVYGDSGGLDGVTASTFDQATPGVAGTIEEADQFGAALAAHDFNGDGASELVIGVPFEDLGAISNAGVMHVLFGASSSGLSSSGSVLYGKEQLGGIAEVEDRFGSLLAR